MPDEKHVLRFNTPAELLMSRSPPPPSPEEGAPLTTVHATHASKASKFRRASSSLPPAAARVTGGVCPHTPLGRCPRFPSFATASQPLRRRPAFRPNRMPHRHASACATVRPRQPPPVSRFVTHGPRPALQPHPHQAQAQPRLATAAATTKRNDGRR